MNQIAGGQALYLVLVATLFITACVTVRKPEGVGAAVPWESLPGWNEDDLTAAWPALQQSCNKMPARDAGWQPICEAASAINPVERNAVKTFFQQWFIPHETIAANGTPDGLITGYYTPLLNGSLTMDARFRHPIYQRPPDLLTIELREIYPDLSARPLRGRLLGNRVVPYYSRFEIETKNPLQGLEMAWVDDPVALFFLHIQGSGRIRLPDGGILSVGYAEQNGHPYIAVGKVMADQGLLPLEEVSLQSIRTWLHAHPEQAEAVLQANPSYVFFLDRGRNAGPPFGSLDIPLTAERSIAVDRRFIPLGVPVWLQTTWPDNAEKLQRLVFAQDTGGAIKGAVRADIYWGEGERAEQLAGLMKQTGRLYVLLPVNLPGPALQSQTR